MTYTSTSTLLSSPVAGTPVLPLPALVAFSQAILCCCEKKYQNRTLWVMQV